MSAVLTTLEATNVAIELLVVATNAAVAFQQVSAIVAKAQAEGRELTAEDWASLDLARSAAKQAFEDALAKAE